MAGVLWQIASDRRPREWSRRSVSTLRALVGFCGHFAALRSSSVKAATVKLPDEA